MKNWTVLNREADWVKKTRMFISLLESARTVQEQNPHLAPGCAAEVQNFESYLRDTFGLIYLQAHCITDADEWKAYCDLEKEVEKVMPEYIAKLPKIKRAKK